MQVSPIFGFDETLVKARLSKGQFDEGRVVGTEVEGSGQGSEKHPRQWQLKSKA